jgi:hypothetical protein
MTASASCAGWLQRLARAHKRHAQTPLACVRTDAARGRSQTERKRSAGAADRAPTPRHPEMGTRGRRSGYVASARAVWGLTFAPCATTAASSQTQRRSRRAQCERADRAPGVRQTGTRPTAQEHGPHNQVRTRGVRHCCSTATDLTLCVEQQHAELVPNAVVHRARRTSAKSSYLLYHLVDARGALRRCNSSVHGRRPPERRHPSPRSSRPPTCDGYHVCARP